MAPKTKKRNAPKTRAEKRSQNYVYFMALVVIVSMLLSGLYFLGASDGGSRTEDTGDETGLYFNSYSLNQVGGGAVLVEVQDPSREYVAFVKTSCINIQNVKWVYNLTSVIPGLKSAVLDAANPRGGGYGICGDFLFFRLAFDKVDEETVKTLEAELGPRLPEYALKRGYTALLPTNLSGPGTDKAYVIGSPDVKKGDYASIFLFQKTGDGTVFALERKTIPEGPTVSAVVKGLDELVFSGTIQGDFDAAAARDALNLTDERIYPPTMVVNETLTEETAGELSLLEGVKVRTEGNQTMIEFNSSKNGIEGILDRGNLEYSLTEGSALFRTPLDMNSSRASKVLETSGLGDVRVAKAGTVETPSEILLEGTVVGIQEYKNFNSLLDLDTKVGDKIHINVSYMLFGDQAIILGGSQVP
ncbi:MAG: hypothetical protein JW724_05805 [Candidatus Altiarchaeota archaeon]|nr:hypothetical protein [Candidatus Altiarchaeota archaeon]